MSKATAVAVNNPAMIEKRKKIKAFVEEYCKSSMFRVHFIKKTDGASREMTCRSGVFKYSKGGVSGAAHCEDILGTYDMNIASKLPEEERFKAHRSIWLDTVTLIKSGDNELRF